MRLIQNSYNPTVSTTELEILDPVMKAEVLLLDDLGAIRPTEWVWDTVSVVLNSRYNSKRTTIITTILNRVANNRASGFYLALGYHLKSGHLLFGYSNWPCFKRGLTRFSVPPDLKQQLTLPLFQPSLG